MDNRIQKLAHLFEREFGNPPEIAVKAPGRVDLMGNHTDYNEGFVLPVALDVDVLAIGRVRNDNVMRVISADLPGVSIWCLDEIVSDDKNTWANYIRGVVKYLQENDYRLGGADIAISSNVPIGSGLSSSAALEMASGYLLQILFDLDIPPVDLALIGQNAENKFVGVSTGIMDQFVSRLGKKDHALFIDCRDYTYRHVPLVSADVSILICDTNKRRGLVDSEYDLRRKQCNEAVSTLKSELPAIHALRDVTREQLQTYRRLLTEVVAKRAQHVVDENQRVLNGCKLLESGDYRSFGQLMNQSHDSARDLYEVSCKELDAMVVASNSISGTLGSRLAGAGFGGCTVSLVEPDAVAEFVDRVPRLYRDKTGLESTVYVCKASDGAEIVRDWRKMP